MNTTDSATTGANTIGAFEVDLRLKDLPTFLAQLGQIKVAAQDASDAVAAIGGINTTTLPSHADYFQRCAAHGFATPFSSNAKAMQRYRAVVEGIVETRTKVAICEAMKADAEHALAAAEKSLSYNLNSLVEAEAELMMIENGLKP